MNEVEKLNFVEAVRLLRDIGGYITCISSVLFSQISYEPYLDVYIIPKGTCILRCVRTSKGKGIFRDPTIRPVDIYLATDFIHINSDDYINAWHECANLNLRYE